MEIARKQIFVVNFLGGDNLLAVNSVTFLVASFFFTKVFPQQKAVRILREFPAFAGGDNHVNAIS